MDQQQNVEALREKLKALEHGLSELRARDPKEYLVLVKEVTDLLEELKP